MSPFVLKQVFWIFQPGQSQIRVGYKLASLWENKASGFPTRCHTEQAVEPHKIATGLKFCIKEVEGLYYLCSENKGADLTAKLICVFVFAMAKSQFSHNEAQSCTATEAS